MEMVIAPDRSSPELPCRSTGYCRMPPFIRIKSNEMVAAFESVLASLRLTDRTDPITELVAKKIIECAQTGEYDRTKLRDCALAAIMSFGSFDGGVLWLKITASMSGST